jgi:para-nitrobenzyl esterase
MQMRTEGTSWRTRARLGAAVIAAGALMAGCAATTTATAAAGTANTANTAAASTGAAGLQASGGPVVTTAGGAVQGTTSGGTSQWLGIPYAAPPVGPLRWHAPEPAAPWKGVRAATSFGANCPQSTSPFGLASTSENCLFLNVYAPAGLRGKIGHLPVMFWIHGGALVTGESNDYNPAKLVAKGTVVVTINYRLGALGFLAHPALAGPGGSSGNYGLMDQQAALRWVQRNIARFGGNPRNVTIFGESAGGLSVLSQVTSPIARGLFSRAIVESGAYALTEAPLATAESAGQAFATKAGCPDQTAACLRALPVPAVLANQNAAGYQPDIDGAVLHQSIGTALASGQFNRVPLINGSNHDEFRLFVALDQLEGQPAVTADNYVASIEAELGLPAAAAQAVAAKYPVANFSSPPVALGAAGTDVVFACPALTVDQSASKFVPVHAYEFADENAPERFLPPLGFPYGAAHASEIQYLFDLSAAIPGPLNAAQQQLSAAMQQYWTNFAKIGIPSSPNVPLWPAFTTAGQQMISLAPPRPTVTTTFAVRHNCAFWAALESAG